MSFRTFFQHLWLKVSERSLAAQSLVKSLKQGITKVDAPYWRLGGSPAHGRIRLF
jgi:hypothetical protein